MKCRRGYGAYPAPKLLQGTPYGLCEIYRERLRNAKLISTPGCYATSVLLPLIPLLMDRMVEASDVVNVFGGQHVAWLERREGRRQSLAFLITHRFNRHGR